ncbi:aromatic amino acid lyase [Actinoplanes sp. Pm04-4]|uniref:Aromatic amino acid lyase n=1 Tax=Paractinoplanes pyxinae TaxID=2997416 RepID=A0ABT4B961_9ACTN|nr:aromatic amino acid lyase [Actinoplanes pyxinae]MCY1143043.1 aromatic amino acid lyase [Actinoplanes pyxinae]
MKHVVIHKRQELDRTVILAVARGNCQLELAPELIAALTESRRSALADLAGRVVYGVNTGMGAMSGLRLDAEAQRRHQDNLMLGRAVGSPPWLRRDHARALFAARLRTFLDPAAGVSPELCRHLTAVLNADVIPAIPAHGSGAAGEIIPLAHAGAALLGAGQVLEDDPLPDPSPASSQSEAANPGQAGGAGQIGGTGQAGGSGRADGAGQGGGTGQTERAGQTGGVVQTDGAGRAGGAPQVRWAGPPRDASPVAVDAEPALTKAGLAPTSFGPKEGIAFLEGVPGLTGLAVLGSAAAHTLIGQLIVGAAASHTAIRASLDPLQAALADSDELGAVLNELRRRRGEGEPGALQAPVSFRVTAPALAVAQRAVEALDAAIDRSLNAVTDSPAHLDGEFVGTFGFAGTDLTAALGALTTALVHLAELGAARLHRLLDPRVTGLAPQLSHSPGLHAGMAAVHKRAAGVTHRLRRFALPTLTGAIETSLGQEDVQSFGFEAAECLDEVLTGLRDVLAAELLAVIQAQRLGAPRSPALNDLDAALPPGTADRPFGRDMDHIIDRLAGGWPT